MPVRPDIWSSFDAGLQLKTQRELGPDDLRVAIQSVKMAEKSEKSRLATPA